MVNICLFYFPLCNLKISTPVSPSEKMHHLSQTTFTKSCSMLLVYSVYSFKQVQKGHSSVGMVLCNQIKGPHIVPFNENKPYSVYFKYLFAL